MPDTSADLTLDLFLDGISPEMVLRGWTEADLMLNWFTPAPVVTVEAVCEPNPGGRFYTKMRLPDGTEIDGEGCYLEVTPVRVVWTNALEAGFRPRPAPILPFAMTAEITATAEGTGTRYRVRVRHASAADASTHAAMGFEPGWTAAIAQLQALAQGLA